MIFTCTWSTSLGRRLALAAEVRTRYRIPTSAPVSALVPSYLPFKSRSKILGEGVDQLIAEFVMKNGVLVAVA